MSRLLRKISIILQLEIELKNKTKNFHIFGQICINHVNVFNEFVVAACANDCPIVLTAEENHCLDGHPDLHVSFARRPLLTSSSLSLNMQGHRWYCEIHPACNAQKLCLRETKRFSVCTQILHHTKIKIEDIIKLPPVDTAWSIKSAAE